MVEAFSLLLCYNLYINIIVELSKSICQNNIMADTFINLWFDLTINFH